LSDVKQLGYRLSLQPGLGCGWFSQYLIKPAPADRGIRTWKHKFSGVIDILKPKLIAAE
jgi:hypothetical protein